VLCLPRLTVAIVVASLVASACAAQTVAPNSGSVAPASRTRAISPRPVDTTSILKQDTKEVTIGSTVDATNGDMGPTAISIVPGKVKKGLQKGNLVVCNFENSAGYQGQGTTLEILEPAANSPTKQFAQNDAFEGCDAVALNTANDVYAGGLTSGEMAVFSPTGGVPIKTYGSSSPVGAPLSDTNAPPVKAFDPAYVYVGATTSGGIASISDGEYGDGQATQVAEGFAVSQGSGQPLGPSGLQYSKSLDVLYIVDGVTNTIVGFTNASKLLVQDEIVVEPGGQTFQCLYPSVTCGFLVFADTSSYSPLNAPVASALLPNGNLIVANTQGTPNTLVELTPTGQILDTAVINSNDTTPGIYGLVAAGTKDANTVIYFTDMNTNEVYELEKPPKK